MNEWMEPGNRLKQGSRLHGHLRISLGNNGNCRRRGQCRGQLTDVTDVEAVPIDYLKGILNCQVRCHASSRRFSKLAS